MIGRRLPEDSDRGETLVELLIAMVLLGVAVVSIVTGLGASALVSDAHRKQTTAGSEVRSFAEKIENVVNVNTTGNSVGYVACATTSTYATAYAAPTGFTSSVTAVRYWSGTAWAASCSTDIGMQKLTLQIRSNDNRAIETLDVVLRKPCSTGQTCS